VPIVEKNVCTDGEKNQTKFIKFYVYKKIDADVITLHCLRMLKERERVKE